MHKTVFLSFLFCFSLELRSVHALLGSGAGSIINITGASITNTGVMGEHAGTINFNSGTIFNETGAQIGPTELRQLNGKLVNEGIIYLDKLSYDGSWTREGANSVISGGTLSGSGQIWVAGTAQCSIPLTVGTITVGQGVDLTNFSELMNALGSLVVTNHVLIDAPLLVTGSGTLQGVGTITYPTVIYGALAPGVSATELGTLEANSDVTLQGTAANLRIAINGASASLVEVNGTFAFVDGPFVDIESVIRPPRGTNSYTIADFEYFSGTVTQVVNQAGIGDKYSLTLLPNSLVLNIVFPTTIPIPTGCSCNAQVTARLLNAIEHDCPPTTSILIDDILQSDADAQLQALQELSPGWKKVQLSLEKLDLLLHKEVEELLYSKKTGDTHFLLGGYDVLKQGAECCYYGYDVQNFYQLIGMKLDYSSFKWLWALGVSESFMKVQELPANAELITFWGTVGFAGFHNRWRYGVEALVGCGSLHGSTLINLIEKKARAKSTLWDLSAQGTLFYDLNGDRLNFSLYEQLGYNYGHASGYLGYNALGANLNVKGSAVTVWRNALGAILEMPSKSAMKLFLDTSWVYDYYLSGRSLYAAFEATDVYGRYTEQLPTKNYARVRVGLYSAHPRLDWELSYTGLYGVKLRDNAASIKLIMKF